MFAPDLNKQPTPISDAELIKKVQEMDVPARQRLMDSLGVQNMIGMESVIKNNRPKFIAAFERSMMPQFISRGELARRLEMGLSANDIGINLRCNQLEAIRKLVEFLKETGDTKGYFEQPTGAGKTFLFGLIAKLLDVETLVLVPTNNLVQQTKREFIECLGFKEDEIGIVESGKDAPKGKKVVIGTYQSHISRLKPERKKQDIDYRNLVTKTSLVICDEAHRGIGEKTAAAVGIFEDSDDSLSPEEAKFQDQALSDIERLTSKNSLILGFTATPELSAKHVENYFGRCIARETHDNMVESGILVPYETHNVEGEMEDGEITSSTTADEEGEFLRKQNMYAKLIEKWEDIYAGLPGNNSLRTAVFCANIRECDNFAQVADEKSYRYKIVTSREGKESLREAEQSLLKGDIDFIITVNMLGEGWDLRPLNAVILARATQSPVKLIQPAGRGARTQNNTETQEYSSKTVCHVFQGHFSISSKEKRAGMAVVAKDMHEEGFTTVKPKGSSSGEGAPLTLEEALALAGNETSSILVSAEGKFRKVVILDETNGVGIVEMARGPREIVYLPRYADFFDKRIPLTQDKLTAYGGENLKKVFINGGLARCGRERIRDNVYLKKSVDDVIKRIFATEVHFDDKFTGSIVDMDKIDEILNTGVLQFSDEIVYLNGYLKIKLSSLPIQIDAEDFEKFLESKGYNPYSTNGKKLFASTGKPMTNQRIYRKADADKAIDEYISSVKERELRSSGFIVLERGDIENEIAFTVKIGGKEVSLRKSGIYNRGKLSGGFIESVYELTGMLNGLSDIQLNWLKARIDGQSDGTSLYMEIEYFNENKKSSKLNFGHDATADLVDEAIQSLIKAINQILISRGGAEARSAVA